MITPTDTPTGENTVLQSAPMADDALIRLQRLKELGLTAAALSQRVGGRNTYWHDMLAGKKSFGERSARKIEDALNLPRGHLDTPTMSHSGAALAPPVATDHATPYNAATQQPAPGVGSAHPAPGGNGNGYSRMAMDLAIEFDHMQATDHEKRMIYAHCMMLINRNPLVLRALGIADHEGDDEPPSATPGHSRKKSSSPPRA